MSVSQCKNNASVDVVLQLKLDNIISAQKNYSQYV